MVRILFQVRDVYGSSFLCFFSHSRHFYDDSRFSDKEEEEEELRA